MAYDHTQTSPLYLIVVLVGAVMLVTGWWIPDPAGQVAFVIGGILILLLAACFRHLTVRDEQEDLLIQFGPLPLFRRRLRYAHIEKVEPSRSSILDGWGIHMSPSGGWTWNIWGRDCVDVWYRKGSRMKKLRIGTDDPEGLTAFLRGRLERPLQEQR